MTPNDHNYFVIIANELVILLTNASRFMDIPRKVQEEAEDDIVLPIIEELIVLGLKMNSKSLWLNLKHEY